MTNKQQKILSSALKLFAKQGFDATSTRSIAQDAGVSEGLIFRHFENKVGLLKVLHKNGQQKHEKLIHTIESLTHPKVILKHVISLPFNMADHQREYWSFFYSLRWHMNIDKGSFLERLSNIVTNAFKSLDFSDPQSESETFMMIWEGAMIYILLNNPQNSFVIFETLLKKFKL
jgi:AcrR family transcriptional regulator